MRREVMVFISIVVVFAAGYLVVDQALKRALRAPGTTPDFAQYAAQQQARAKEDQDCLDRYEAMVQSGALDATQLCGPPPRVTVVEPPFHQKLLDAVTQIIHGTQSPLETKETS